MIEVLIPIGAILAGGTIILIFFQFRKPKILEGGWFEEDIPDERQPYISSHCGKIIGSPNPNSKGENFSGRIIRRRTYKDLWDIVILDKQTKRTIELKNLHYGTNLLVKPNAELVAGCVELITNIDANGEICEWDTTGLEMYKVQFDEIYKEKGRQEALQKMKELREERHILRSPYAKPSEEEMKEVLEEA